MRRLTLIATALLLITPFGIAGPGEDFSAANQALLDGDSESAYSAYQSLLDDGHINADLLYNLGNASYRLDRPGEAALWYERSLTLDPTHKEARQNLRFLKRKGGLLQFESRNHSSPVSSFRKNTLWQITACAAWLALLGFAAAITMRLNPACKSALWICSPLLALAAIAAAIGIYIKHQRQSDLATQAIVTAPNLKAYTAPARTSSTIIELPPGSQIKLVSTRGNWRYVDLPGELRGWVPGGSITPLWPYDSALAE